MPREARFLGHGACYHITSRGNDGVNVFLGESDYRYYLRLLKKYKRKYGVNVFAFCLMPDAAHLIVQPARARDLSLFMQGVSQSYSINFNARYQKKGSVWKGRFKSIILLEDIDLIDCIKHIEFKPVREEIAYSPVEYPWSSCSLRVLGYRNIILDSMAISRGDLTLPETPSSPGFHRKTKEGNGSPRKD